MADLLQALLKRDAYPAYQIVQACQQGFDVLLEMARHDKHRQKLKDIVLQNKDRMGMLLLPAQWNLNITRTSVVYSAGMDVLSLGLVHIKRISPEIVEMPSKARPKRLTCVCT